MVYLCKERRLVSWGKGGMGVSCSRVNDVRRLIDRRDALSRHPLNGALSVPGQQLYGGMHTKSCTSAAHLLRCGSGGYLGWYTYLVGRYST